MAKGFGWALWYIRPKIHMMQHVVFHACKFLYAWSTSKTSFASAWQSKAFHGTSNCRSKLPMGPQSSQFGSYFFDLFCMLNAHTTRNLGGIFCCLANKAQVAGQMKTWLVKFREAPGIACIQHGYAIEFCPGFYFPTEGSGIVLVRWNYSLVAALPAPGPELAEIRT